jgi:hypothetical protein
MRYSLGLACAWMVFGVLGFFTQNDLHTIIGLINSSIWQGVDTLEQKSCGCFD